MSDTKINNLNALTRDLGNGKPYYKGVHPIEYQRLLNTESRQLGEIKDDWEELMKLIAQRQEENLKVPKNIKKVLDLDNLITERTQEYAKATIYIHLT